MSGYRLFQILGITVWAAFAVWLGWRIHHPPPSAVQLALTNLKLSENADYTGVFLKGERVGYASTSITPYGSFSLLQESSYMRLPMGGIISEVIMEQVLTLDSTFRVINFHFTLTSGEYETNIQGQFKSEFVVVNIQVGGKVVTDSLPVTGPCYSPSVVSRMMAKRGWPHDTLHLPTYDPISLTQQQIVAWAEPGPGKRLLLHMGFGGSESVQEVDSSGRLMLETSPAGMELRAMTRQEALAFLDSKPSESLDLLKSFSVLPTGKPIEDARKVNYLKVQVEGLPSEGFDLEDGCQRIVSRNPLVLEIGPRNPHYVWPSESLYLMPTRTVQSQDLRILDKATEIIEEHGHHHHRDLHRAEKLNQWVFTSVKKKYTVSVPSAVDVLEQMEGDCNEHSVLLTALARSVGYPAQMDAGLVFLDGRFYYHAWVTIETDQGKIPLDPTFGQNHADATHLKLLAGELDRQVELIRILGKVKITVLEVGYEPSGATS